MSTRFLMFGLQEAEEGKEDDLVDAVATTFEKTVVVPFPAIHIVFMLGEKKQETLDP